MRYMNLGCLMICAFSALYFVYQDMSARAKLNELAASQSIRNELQELRRQGAIKP
jgi:hypothetical protein